MGDDTKNARLVTLDFVRGLSALMVLFSHAREYILVPLSELESPGLVTRLFYFFTGFGREAVMIFFVLSGFFISRSILNLLARNDWTWRRYLVSRMSRLWLVLIPALLLTAMWDHLGILLGATDFYEGRLFRQYDSVPLGDAGIDLSLAGFLQNSVFLVWITTPVYGTNGPLWSLTYEFWYYMLFPLAYLIFLPLTGPVAKFLSTGIFLFLIWFLPLPMLLLGIVWLYGYAVLILSRLDSVQRMARSREFFAASFVIFAALLTATGMELIENQLIGNLCLGLAFSLFMLALIVHEARSRLFLAVSKFISKISYSLYLVHFSFLGFVVSIGLQNRQWQLDSGGISLFFGLCILSVGYASLVYWVFERNTYRVIAVMRRVFRC